MSESPILELEGIVKRFGRVSVAERLSFSVSEGEALGIVGPNGAGKTSLFGIISGDIRPDDGHVKLNGQNIDKADSARRCRSGIGRTYQVPRAFEKMSVFENVLVAAQQGGGLRKTLAFDASVATLEETGLLPFANTAAGQLGLLDRKRLELAKALATQPTILLLDEVAGGLTDPEVDELIGIVGGARSRGVAVIWIEHVVRALLESVDRLICVAGGSIIGEGSPHEVLQMDAVREVFLGGDLGQDHRDTSPIRSLASGSDEPYRSELPEEGSADGRV